MITRVGKLTFQKTNVQQAELLDFPLGTGRKVDIRCAPGICDVRKAEGSEMQKKRAGEAVQSARSQCWKRHQSIFQVKPESLSDSGPKLLLSLISACTVYPLNLLFVQCIQISSTHSNDLFDSYTGAILIQDCPEMLTFLSAE